jgi:hypothetical protein
LCQPLRSSKSCSKLHFPAPKMRCGEVNSLEAPLAFPPPPQQARCNPFPNLVQT